MRSTRIPKTGALLIALLLLSSCGLLPEEKQYARVPLVREYTAPDYTLAYVQRGEFSITENVSCRYMPVRESALSFGVSGIYYEAVYVQEGELVQEGQLLAVLEMGTLPQEIAEAENQLALLELERSQLLERQALAVRHQRERLSRLTPEQRALEESVEQIEQNYADQAQRGEDAIYLQALRLDALRDRRARREIRADMDGTVTYLRKTKAGDRSVDGVVFLRVADMTHSVFMASTERWAFFHPGDIITITSSRLPYEAVVMDEAELARDTAQDPTALKRNVYFGLTVPAPELEEGDQGSVTLVLEYRADTLFLDKKALHSVNGERIVYFQDPETGIRGFKNVTTGLETVRYVEILDGLQEGESVILR